MRAIDTSRVEDYQAAFVDLAQTVLTLKNPDGCPWDAKQTHKSLRRYFLEEVCEVLEALDNADRDALEEELGDVMVHILFQADIAARAGSFDLTTVLRKAAAKLRRRHPQVFGAPRQRRNLNSEQTESQWEAIKRAESGRKSILKSLPPQLSAVAAASAIQKSAVKAGLPPPAAPLNESPRDERQAGDALMALIHKIVAAGIDPESALRVSARRLQTRIRAIERAAGKPLDAIAADERKRLLSDIFASKDC